MSDTPHPRHKLFSFGFRCSSAAIIKRLGLKQESFPFDWLVSRPSVVQHCIESDFAEFLNKENYERRYTNTYEMANSHNRFICDEHIMMNRYYQPSQSPNPENTYQYYLAMNHHNICESGDHEYYSRCVDRFRALILSDESKIYLHIRPLILLSEYEQEETHREIMAECMAFDGSVQKKMKSTKGIIFIMTRDDNVDHFRIETLQTLESKTVIYLITANRGFIDAGEIFMGEFHGELDRIMNIVRSAAFDV